ncbi:MAG: DEAD/DEAH box helicase, partial [Deltaproteobacteria bacterium]|nr:DEAD/DEAH box helicase [Deltaproteobacteria bacterium]
MIFYNQVKREFTQASWKRGQIYFREERVRDVRLTGNTISAKVQGTDEAAYETAIVMARGTIFNSDCSCPAHRLYESHCKHVAALTIWMLERGSLLRSGVGDEDDGVADLDHFLVLRDVDKAAVDVRLRGLIRTNVQLRRGRFMLRKDGTGGIVEGRDESGREFSIPITAPEAIALREHTVREEEKAQPVELLKADPVAFVRGIFLNKALNAITVEPAARYYDPVSHEAQVETLNHLVRQSEFRTWRTQGGLYLKFTSDVVPVLGSLEAGKIIYQGPAALENLAKLLSSEYRSHIVFHRALDVEIDPKPLKLVSLSIGKKTDKSRALTFEFKNHSAAFTSDELARLAEQGLLSSQYVWKDNKLYKFETSLNQLNRFANRSGVVSPETETKKLAAPDGFATLDDDSAHPLHPLAAYRLSLELGVENFNVDPDWTEFHEWRKNFEKKKTPPLPEVDYVFGLRDYQANGLSWLWSLYHRGLSALLADDMGLGKTHQVLALLTSVYTKKSLRPKHPTLVVAPTSVVAAWSQKLQKYDTQLKWHIFHGKARTLREDVDLVLTTYGILQKEEVLRSREWHMVILDEAQAIKNSSTISARASRSLKAKYRCAMTGTPVENQSTDLWSIMEFLLPGYLGSLPRFKRLYGSGREAPSPYQAEALKRLVSPFLLRRTKAQVLKELPEKTEEIIDCQLTPAQKKAYRAWLASSEADEVRKSLEGAGKVDYASILALLTRLKQVCDHPRLPDLTSGKVKKITALDPLESGKWEVLEELISEALGSELKVVVFTQYLGMIDLIANAMKEKGVGYTELRGDTSDRAERLNKFATDPDCRVFICSLLAGGLGIDLTSASVCIHVDRWWNPAKENQATDRLHRIGQTRGVQVFKLQTPGTIEDRIAAIIESKVALSGTLIEESPVGLKSFSRKELLDLLTDPVE